MGSCVIFAEIPLATVRRASLGTPLFRARSAGTRNPRPPPEGDGEGLARKDFPKVSLSPLVIAKPPTQEQPGPAGPMRAIEHQLLPDAQSLPPSQVKPPPG